MIQDEVNLLHAYVVQSRPNHPLKFRGNETFVAHRVVTQQYSSRRARPLSSEHGTQKTVNARFWPWLSDTCSENVLKRFHKTVEVKAVLKTFSYSLDRGTETRGCTHRFEDFLVVLVRLGVVRATAFFSSAVERLWHI